VYDGKLNAQDLKEVQDNDAASSQAKGFSVGQQPIKNLSEMQEKVWYDVVSQLDFVADFAKLKERVEADGYDINSPKVIKEVQQADIRREEEEKQWVLEQERQRKNVALFQQRSPQQFSSPEGGIENAYNRHFQQDDDIADEEEWVQDRNGNWFRADELTEINAPDDPDMPPEDYAPLWDTEERDMLDSLKRRQRKKRPYLEKEETEEDRWHKQLGEHPLSEFPVEEMDDEEWLRRFGRYFGLSKIAEEEEIDYDKVIESLKKPQENYTFEYGKNVPHVKSFA
ncbi:unnamed protein product, partial [marine sediment metagenome]